MAGNCRTFVLPREWGERMEVIGPITVHEQICRMTDFAAIDFETANEYSSSVCSVGLVVVRDGVVTDRFYSLIHPEPEYFSWFCQQVHGLTEEDCADAPIFPEVWKQIAPRIASQPSLFDASGLGEDSAPRFYDEIPALPLVAHNSPFDERCLRAVFRTYGMDYPDYRFHDTLARRDAILERAWRIINCKRSRPPAVTICSVITTPWPMPRPAPSSP